MIFKIHKQDNFTIINNELINDPLLSAKSKAILIYLLSKPMLWNANIKDISNHFTDGLDAVKSALNELEKNYYLRRTRVRTDKGTFKTIYDAYESKYSNPKNINYKEIGGLSSESCQALELARPSDLASAARVPGVTAAALSSVLLYTKKKEKKVV